jgi:hypothetical protein
MLRAFFLALAACSLVCAADPRIDSLRALLIPLRTERSDDPPVRGATPALTDVKHELRDWVESRMKPLDQTGETSALQKDLNSDLRAAGLVCGWDPTDKRCPERLQLGYLSTIEFRRAGNLLTLITGVGILCGFDDSAYLYGWSETEGWHRVWQTEQDSYTETAYKPQNIDSVQVSPSTTANDYLVLTLGTQPWCSSNWRSVYYRVFRSSNAESKPLVDGDEYAFVEAGIQGNITATDVTVEFSVGSIDPGIHSRGAIRHYLIDHEHVTRVEPFAMSPRDFTEEWLTHDWGTEVARWSDRDHLGALLGWHKKLHQDHTFATSISPALHCRATADLWQVGFDFSDPPTPSDKPAVGAYFLVRWRPPFRFTMVSISNHADSKCNEKKSGSDDAQ